MNHKYKNGLLGITLLISLCCFSNTAKDNRGHIVASKMVTPTDPYYTGASKITDFDYHYGDKFYQNVFYDYLGDIEAVWDNYQGENVTVAIIDTGMSSTHKDLKDSIHEKSCYIQTIWNKTETDFTTKYTYYSNNHSCINPDWYVDEYYEEEYWDDHGTNGAGCIGAKMDGSGCVGVAPKSSLMVIKNDFDTYSIEEAIKYAADNGADIINISLGFYEDDAYDSNHELVEEGFEDASTYLEEACLYAYNKGCIVIAAGGNENSTSKLYPACNSHVIGVGALEEYSSSQIASWSNYNAKTDKSNGNNNVDLLAPGSVVTDAYLGTKRAGYDGYRFTSGTSFAAPIVSGAAALWVESHLNTYSTRSTSRVDAFRQALQNSCDDMYNVGWDAKSGFGSLNVYNLVNDIKGSGQGSGTQTTDYGSLDNPISISEALAIAEEECILNNDVTKEEIYSKGIVSSIGETTSFGYKNVMVKDEHNDSEILIYTLNATETFSVGSTIVFHGYIKNYNGVLEFATNNSKYVVLDKVFGTIVPPSEISLMLSKNIIIAQANDSYTVKLSLSGNTTAPTNIVWTSSNEDVCIVNKISDRLAVIECLQNGAAAITCKVDVEGVHLEKTIDVTVQDPQIIFPNFSCISSIGSISLIMSISALVGIGLIVISKKRKELE